MEFKDLVNIKTNVYSFQTKHTLTTLEIEILIDSVSRLAFHSYLVFHSVQLDDP